MSARPTFLVVDDAPLFRELESLFLSRHGRVLTAKDASEALACVERDRPDVVVLDLSLPDADGVELCGRILERAAPPPPRIVAVGSGDAMQHERAIRAGASDVISKPITRHALVEAAGRFAEAESPVGLPRAPIQVPVSMTVGGHRVQAIARNVSRGGMFLEPGSDPTPPGRLSLSFQLPDGGTEPIEPTADIVWRRPPSDAVPPGIGVRFLSLDGGSARRLSHYVEEYGPLTNTPAILGGLPL